MKSSKWNSVLIWKLVEIVFLPFVFFGKFKESNSNAKKMPVFVYCNGSNNLKDYLYFWYEVIFWSITLLESMNNRISNLEM